MSHLILPGIMQQARNFPFRGHPTLATNLFSGYKLDETSGTTAADVLGNYNGSNSGCSINQTGIVGRSYAWDNSTDYVNLGSIYDYAWLHGADDTSSFALSISVWVKVDSFASSTLNTILCNNSLTSNQRGIFFTVDNRTTIGRTRRVMFNLSNGVGGAQFVTSVELDEGFPNDTDFHHIVVTHDQSLSSNNTKLYIDGTFVAQATKSALTPSTLNASQSLFVGKANASDSFTLDGNLDELYFWKKVLTDNSPSIGNAAGGEVAALYNSGNGLSY